MKKIILILILLFVFSSPCYADEYPWICEMSTDSSIPLSYEWSISVNVNSSSIGGKVLDNGKDIIGFMYVFTRAYNSPDTTATLAISPNCYTQNLSTGEMTIPAGCIFQVDNSNQAVINADFPQSAVSYDITMQSSYNSAYGFIYIFNVVDEDGQVHGSYSCDGLIDVDAFANSCLNGGSSGDSEYLIVCGWNDEEVDEHLNWLELIYLKICDIYDFLLNDLETVIKNAVIREDFTSEDLAVIENKIDMISAQLGGQTIEDIQNTVEIIDTSSWSASPTGGNLPVIATQYKGVDMVFMDLNNPFFSDMITTIRGLMLMVLTVSFVFTVLSIFNINFKV